MPLFRAVSNPQLYFVYVSNQYLYLSKEVQAKKYKWSNQPAPLHAKRFIQEGTCKVQNTQNSLRWIIQ